MQACVASWGRVAARPSASTIRPLAASHGPVSPHAGGLLRRRIYCTGTRHSTTPAEVKQDIRDPLPIHLAPSPSTTHRPPTHPLTSPPARPPTRPPRRLDETTAQRRSRHPDYAEAMGGDEGTRRRGREGLWNVVEFRRLVRWRRNIAARPATDMTATAASQRHFVPPRLPSHASARSSLLRRGAPTAQPIRKGLGLCSTRIGCR